MSSNWRDKGSKKQSYYWKQSNPHKKSKAGKYLSPGQSGFLCTCVGKFREKECVRDSFNLLNEFADKLLGQESNPERIDAEPDSDQDVDESLEKELASLQEKKKVSRFQVADSGVNGVVFILSTVPDPVNLAFNIVTEVAATKMQKSKFLLRLLPVEVTCKANLDEVRKAAAPLLKKYFAEGEKTFSIIFSHRLNDNLSRDSVIEALAADVVSVNATCKVDLKAAQLSIIVEVIRGVCCLAVVPDFNKMKKYNILELSGQANKDTDEQQRRQQPQEEEEKMEKSDLTNHPDE